MKLKVSEKMLKYKDPKTGEVFNDIMSAVWMYCKGKRCDVCVMSDNTVCQYKWAKDHPAEAARLMNYEIIDDTPTEIDDTPTWELVKHGRLEYTGWDEAWCGWGRCTVCGGDNRMGSNYCNDCGSKLDGGAHNKEGK